MELKRFIVVVAAVASTLLPACLRAPAPPLSPQAKAVVMVTSNPAQAMLLARVCEPVGVVEGTSPNALRERAAAEGRQVVEVLYTDPNAGRKPKTTAVLHQCDPSLDIEAWLTELD